MSVRQYIKKRYIRLTESRWIVGVAEFDQDIVLNAHKKLKVHWIKPRSKDSWFADPFILSEDSDYIQILAEEYYYSNHKGRISKLWVNRHSWTIDRVTPVIDISTHLSFPAYYRLGDNVYIYPESTQSGKLVLYEYDERSETAIPIKTVSNYPLADATLFQTGTKKVLLATTSPNDNGYVLDVYPWSDDPSLGPEISISFQTRVARNAGLPFRVGERIIRPAQDCSRSYGACIVLQEMYFNDSIIEFKEIKRLQSPLFFYQEAFHTFNVFENKLVAVDAAGFRYGIFAQLVHHIRVLFK